MSSITRAETDSSDAVAGGRWKRFWRPHWKSILLAFAASTPGWIALWLTITDPAREVIQKQLSLRPHLLITEYSFGYDNLTIPPYIKLENVGNSDARGVEFYINIAKYPINHPKSISYFSSSDCTYNFPKIAADSSVLFTFDSSCFREGFKGDSLTQYAIELRWRYRRLRDGQRYDARVNYFFTPDNRIASPNSSVVDSIPMIGKMKEALIDAEWFKPRLIFPATPQEREVPDNEP